VVVPVGAVPAAVAGREAADRAGESNP
jgi:hypothetical protein